MIQCRRHISIRSANWGIFNGSQCAAFQERPHPTIQSAVLIVYTRQCCQIAVATATVGAVLLECAVLLERRTFAAKITNLKKEIHIFYFLSLKFRPFLIWFAKKDKIIFFKLQIIATKIKIHFFGRFFQSSAAAAANNLKRWKMFFLHIHILCTNHMLFGRGYRGNIFFINKKMEKRKIENVKNFLFSWKYSLLPFRVCY